MSGQAIPVLFVQRKPTEGQISIERLFADIRDAMTDSVAAVVHISPFHTKGLIPRFRNLLAVSTAAKGYRVCHITGDVHYLALGLPRERLVLTIHDCAVLHRLRGWRRELIRRVWFEWPVRRAAVVTTISETSRQDLMQWLPAGLADKIRVVPDCVGSDFVPSPKPFDDACPVFLQVGTKWNKNLERVVEALAGIRCRLVVVGELEKERERSLQSKGVAITFLRRVSDAELLEAYQCCDAVIFASLFEGFGLPILEAQSIGRPVIASECSSMPEVAGDGAVLVNPEDVDSIRAAVRRVLVDAGLRKSLVDRGFENVRRFQAEAVAARYASIYREVADKSAAVSE